ncbi:MAG: 3-deoxy-manno-octulosonate cytidylyltransferase [Chthoniobacterales bacterium]|nr:3-deoxy-manno-octulosonate cytidylyltransferase [Chthoniobacterales bacterium]
MAFKAVCIIPARWGSTRFPGKPLHEIAGKPLLQRVWERCRRARDLDGLIIATDDMRVAEAAFDWGAEVSLTSVKHHSGTDRAAEVAARTRKFSHVINVQGDEPLVDPKLIDRFVLALRADRNLQMITAAHPFDDPADVTSSSQIKVVLNANSDALYFSRSTIPFLRENKTQVGHLRHQGIYGYSRKFLQQFVRWKPSVLERAESLEQLRALENGVRIHVLVTKTGSPGIDTPEDAAALEQVLAVSGRKERRR